MNLLYCCRQAIGPMLVAALLAGVAAPVAAQRIYDPESPAATLLQDPRSVTTWFPRDREQRPDWVDVLRRGLIEPRETLRGEPRPPEAMGPVPQQSIVFTQTAQMPFVLFPHVAHAEWLACTNCHDGLYPRQATGRGSGMRAIFEGRHCGTCHGRVAFSPEGSCFRCHSQPNPAGLIKAPPPESGAESDAAADEGGSKRRRLGGTVEPPRPPIFPARP